MAGGEELHLLTPQPCAICVCVDTQLRETACQGQVGPVIAHGQPRWRDATSRILSVGLTNRKSEDSSFCMCRSRRSHSHRHVGLQGEIPHLCFLIVTYPIIVVASLSCILLCAPITISAFASKKWLDFRASLASRNRISDSITGEDNASSHDSLGV